MSDQPRAPTLAMGYSSTPADPDNGVPEKWFFNGVEYDPDDLPDSDPDARKQTTHFKSAFHADHLAEIVSPWSPRLSSRTDGPVAIQTTVYGIVREQWAAHPDPKSVDEYRTPYRRIHDHHLVDYGIYLHREDGPAEIERIDNPVIERWDGETARPVETWYRNNKEYTPTAHERMKWEARKATQGGTPFHADTLEALAGRNPLMGADGEVWKESRRTATGIDRYFDYTPTTDPVPARTGGVKAAVAAAAAKQAQPEAAAKTGPKKARDDDQR